MIQRLGADSMEDVIGKSDFDFWDLECAQRFFDDEQEIIATGNPMAGQCGEENRIDGMVSWVVSSKMPLYDEDNKIIGTFGISKDITELKQTEIRLAHTHQELLEASRQAGMAEIATNVIHNVGNVLNSINVSIATGRKLLKNQDMTHLRKAADLLEENVNNKDYLLTDSKGKILPGFIKLSAKTLEDTHQKLLDEFDNLRKHLTHVKTVVSMQQEYAGAKNILKDLEVSTLVEDAIQIGEGSLQQSGVAVVKRFEKKIDATVEKHKVLQILINLIRNAKHACEDTNDGRVKEICISIDKVADDFFTIEIADNGVGISQENLTCIFNHGFTTKEKGKGFGLHSSANAAKEMGGSLIATSAGNGRGASFILTLPIKPKERVHTSAKSISDTTVDQPLPPEVAAALLS
jgi:signal transduction histidine kinase